MLVRKPTESEAQDAEWGVGTVIDRQSLRIGDATPDEANRICDLVDIDFPNYDTLPARSGMDFISAMHPFVARAADGSSHIPPREPGTPAGGSVFILLSGWEGDLARLGITWEIEP